MTVAAMVVTVECRWWRVVVARHATWAQTAAPRTTHSPISHHSSLSLFLSPQALADGAVYNAVDAMDVLGVDEETLAARWGGAKSKGKETCVSTLT